MDSKHRQSSERPPRSPRGQQYPSPLIASPPLKGLPSPSRSPARLAGLRSSVPAQLSAQPSLSPWVYRKQNAVDSDLESPSPSRREPDRYLSIKSSGEGPPVPH